MREDSYLACKAALLLKLNCPPTHNLVLDQRFMQHVPLGVWLSEDLNREIDPLFIPGFGQPFAYFA